MITSVFGASPTSGQLFTFACMLLLISMLGQFARRRLIDAARKHDFARATFIVAFMVSCLLMILAVTGPLDTQDLYNWLGQYVAAGLIFLCFITTWNSLRAPGVWGRLIFGLFPLIAAVATIAATVYSHAIYLSATGDTQPPWSGRVYAAAILAVDYLSWFAFVVFIPAVLTVWVVIAIVRRIRNRMSRP